MGKWSRASDQTELQNSSGRGEEFAVIQPQYILWSLVPQGLSSALLQCHPSVKTLNSIQAPLHALGMFRDWDLEAQLSKYQSAQYSVFL